MRIIAKIIEVGSMNERTSQDGSKVFSNIKFLGFEAM